MGQKAGWRTIGVTAVGWRQELRKAKLPVRTYQELVRNSCSTVAIDSLNSCVFRI